MYHNEFAAGLQLLLYRICRFSLLLSTFLAVSGCDFYKESFRDILPKIIKTGSYFDYGWCSYDPFFFGGTGVFLFDIDLQTRAEIREKGLSFFDVLRDRSRAAREELRYFGDWKSTPVEVALLEHGLPRNLDCGEKHAWNWPIGVNEALRQPGSFYLADSFGNGIYVLPNVGVVIVSVQAH